MYRDELARPNPSWVCEPFAQAAFSDAAEDEGTGRNASSAEFLLRGCLRVLQWNADDAKAKVEESEHFICSLRVDVCLIQESKFIDTDRTPRFPGYSVVRHDCQRRSVGGVRGGGLLTLVREDVPFRRCLVRPSRESVLEFLAV